MSRSFNRPLALLVGTLVLCSVCGGLTVGSWWLVRQVTDQSSSRQDNPTRPRRPTAASDTRSAGTPLGSAGAGSSSAPAGSAADAAAPVRGGTLRLPGGKPTTLDPAKVRDLVSADYMYEIYSGLVTLSPTLEVVPDLAERWDVSADGRIYTFTLRTGLSFQDGRPLSAHDVAYGIERTCDPATASLVGKSYLGDIVGCAEKLAGQAKVVRGLDVVDNRHIAITIDQPKSYFLAKLTYPTAFVLDQIQVESDAHWADHPNSTGPFRLTTYDPETKIVLERWEKYYRGPAYLDKVEYDLRPVDPTTRYENGELDATPVSAMDEERVRDPLNPLSHEIVDGPGGLDITYLAMNMRVPPFDDVHVRRALNWVIDKEKLATIVLRGAIKPANGILPPGMPGYHKDIAPYRFDPAKARAELAASRYGGPAGIGAFTLNASGADPVVQAVADMISGTLGITVNIEVAEWDQFQQDIEADRYSAYILGWSADYPDPQDFLDVLFHSRSGLNHLGYSNPQVDTLLEQARVVQDEAERFRLYGEAERQILDDAPWVPIYHGADLWLVAPYVQGFTVPAIVLPRMAKVWLLPAEEH